MHFLRQNLGLTTLLLPLWMALPRSGAGESFALAIMLPLFGLLAVAVTVGLYSWKQQTVVSKVLLVLGVVFFLYSLFPATADVQLIGE